ncbi:MAG: family 1 glycosylhydrolase, partial [Gammaproteobacteria bacterium]|nr:family 1 glycosylhydrolase [Gammaproteobacteria bacterium]
QVIRGRAKIDPVVLAAPVGIIAYPNSDDPVDVEIARKTTFGADGSNLWNNSWYMDPMFLGHYPEEGLRAYGKHLPAFPQSDMDTIQ